MCFKNTLSIHTCTVAIDSFGITKSEVFSRKLPKLILYTKSYAYRLLNSKYVEAHWGNTQCKKASR